MGAVFAHAAVIQGLIDRVGSAVGKLVANVGLGVGCNGLEFDGIIIDLLEAYIFPSNGVAGALAVILEAIDDGDCIVNNEVGVLVHHDGIKSLLPGIEKGIRIDGFTIVPNGIFAQLDLPGILIDLDRELRCQVTNVFKACSAFRGYAAIQRRAAVAIRSFNVSINFPVVVEGRSFAAQIGAVNFSFAFSLLGSFGSIRGFRGLWSIRGFRSIRRIACRRGRASGQRH